MKIIVSTPTEEFTVEVEYTFITHRVPKDKAWLTGHSHQYLKNWAEAHGWKLREWSATDRTSESVNAGNQSAPSSCPHH